jgi:hypothetical protein
MPVIPAFSRLRLEDQKFKVSLDYTGKSLSQKTKSNFNCIFDISLYKIYLLSF